MPDEPNDLFQPVSRELTLSDRVTDEIEALIFQSRLQIGDKLPAERELAKQFGVSRTVIREAVRALVAKGMLEVRMGSGTIVCAPSAASISQSMALYLRGNQRQFDFAHVLEVRSVLEVEIAGLAAERHTVEDVQKMWTILKQAIEIDTREIFIQWDMDFHLLLAQATHNDLFPLLLDSVAEVMRTTRAMAFDIPGAPARSYKYHSAILEQVEKGDRNMARRAMRDHLIEAEATLKQAKALHKAHQQEAVDTDDIK